MVSEDNRVHIIEDRFGPAHYIGAAVFCLIVILVILSPRSSIQKDAAQPANQIQPETKGRKYEALDEKSRQGCAAYGKLAFALATDRDAGISFSQQKRNILATSGGTPMADEMVALADIIYNNPMGKMWSPDGAMGSMYVDCIVRIGKTRAGAKTYNSKPEIDEVLSGFKTFNGKPFTALLLEYGVRISSVEVTPAEYFENSKDKPGDKVLLVILKSRPTKKMPCRLKTWVSGEILPMPEIISRGDEFPLLRPDEDDPLIYWAATGKCSEAYSY
jgi:hypothetical protein